MRKTELALAELDLKMTAAALSGRRLTCVRYFGLLEDSRTSVDWDFGEWHQPVMGVEIEFGAGSATYSAVWGHRFGHFH